LDALAEIRHRAGLPAVSLAWGLWDDGMGGEHADAGRMQKSGVLGLSTEEGLALFDATCGSDIPTLAPIRIDIRALNAAGADRLPPVFHGLIRPTRRAAGGAVAGSLRDKLIGLPIEDRASTVLDMVRREAAAVLGHAGAQAIEPGRAFSELGFDSLSAVEFRNQINVVTGLALPATLIFDYPSSAVLADHLLEELAPSVADGGGEDELRRVLQSIPLARLRDSGLMDSLLELAGVRVAEAAAADADDAESIDEMDTDSLISMALGDLDLDDAMREA
jgi:pimaricinolide synthase PimS1